MCHALPKEVVQAHIGSDNLCCTSIKIQQTTPQARSMLLDQGPGEIQQVWHAIVNAASSDGIVSGSLSSALHVLALQAV